MHEHSKIRTLIFFLIFLKICIGEEGSGPLVSEFISTNKVAAEMESEGVCGA